VIADMRGIKDAYDVDVWLKANLILPPYQIVFCEAVSTPLPVLHFVVVLPPMLHLNQDCSQTIP